MMKKEGKLIIFSAPSGAGKTTIVKALLSKKDLDLAFSISACNRPKRPGEEHGKDYYFITTEDFNNKIEQDEFVEWEEVYHNLFYGTLKSELQRIWSNGQHVLFDIDVKGGLNLKRKFGNRALAIFISPPSIKELKNRLILRSTESENDLNKRLEKANIEMEDADKFDKIIINENLESAIGEAYDMVHKFIRDQS